MESVLYICKCGRQHTIDQLYYCPNCVDIVCPSCVSELIECSYCPSCLTEVSRAQNDISGCRCWRCFECPICSTSLSQLHRSESGSTKAIFYFSCSFCRWNSLCLDIYSDSMEGLVLLCIRNEKDVSAISEFNSKVDQFQQSAKIAMREKSQKSSLVRQPRQKADGKHEHSLNISAEVLPEPVKIEATKPMPIEEDDVRKAANHYGTFPIDILSGLPDSALWDLYPEVLENLGIDIAQESEEMTATDPHAQTESYFETQDASSGLQRCMQPSFRTLLNRKLIPQRKSLISKRSKSCLACNRYLVWADATPKSTGFKVRTLAMNMIPRIVVKDCRQNVSGIYMYLIQITNPTDLPVFIKMNPSEDHIHLGHKIATISNGIVIDSYDDTAGLEPHEDHRHMSAVDDPAFVHQRHGHRVLVWVKSDTMLDKIALDLEVAAYTRPNEASPNRRIGSFTIVLLHSDQSY